MVNQGTAHRQSGVQTDALHRVGFADGAGCICITLGDSHTTASVNTAGRRSSTVRSRSAAAPAAASPPPLLLAGVAACLPYLTLPHACCLLLLLLVSAAVSASCSTTSKLLLLEKRSKAERSAWTKQHGHGQRSSD
jgi:hypothetical protein